METSPLSMEELASLAASASADLAAAQLHGLVCGLVIGARVDSVEVFPIGACLELAGAERLVDQHTLDEFVDAVLGQVHAQDLSFSPLILHVDEEPSAAARELVQWCTAFIGGLSNDLVAADCSDEVNEILEDLVAITHMDHDALGDAEAELDDSLDRDLFELVEYVRVAVLLLLASLADGERPSDDSVPVH